MVSDVQNAKIDADATVDSHLEAIRSEGYHYLVRANKQSLNPVTRQRILSASLIYLKRRSNSNNAVPRSSQGNNLSQNAILSQVTVHTRTTNEKDSSFQVHAAALVDDTIPVRNLIDICVRSANGTFLPILVKSLFVLSTVGSISHDNLAEASQRIPGFSQAADEAVQVVKTNIKRVNDVFQNSQKLLFTQNNNNDNSQGEVNIRRTGQSFVDDFVTNIVKNFIANKPNDDGFNATFISSLAKEAPLSPNVISSILSLLTRGLHNVEITQLPAFIYKLLLFASSKGDSNEKSNVLLSIAELFGELEKKAQKHDQMSQSILAEDEDAIVASGVSIHDLRDVQGTALVHIDYAVKQDPTLSQEVVKLAKGGVELPRHFLTTFGIGIILSVARSVSLQTDVLQLLRETIQKFEKEARFREDNLYAARVTLNDNEVPNPRSSLIQIAQSASENGWDHVKDALLQFSFLLLDQPLQTSNQKKYENDALASNLIMKLFTSQPFMQETILDQLMNRVALQEKSTAIVIEIISKMSKRMPFDLMKHANLIKEGIELLVSLPPWTAEALISAFFPVLSTRKDLQDCFHLVVRKSLFRRDSCARATAIIGFLKAGVMIESSTNRDNADIDVLSHRSQGSQTNNVDATHEILQPLRRIFSCDAPLRAYLYQTVIRTLQSVEGKQIRKRVAVGAEEIIRSQLRRYVEIGRAPYLMIEHTVNENAGGKLVEPLGDLIWCLAVLEFNKDPVKYGDSYIIDLATKVASVSLRDFSFTKESLVTVRDDTEDDQGEAYRASESAAARSTRNKVRILGATIEALTNAVLQIPTSGQSWNRLRQTVAPLLFLRSQILDMLRGAGAASFVDAFHDFGGDHTIERMRPGLRLQCLRGSRASGGTKRKVDTSKKSKGGESSSNQTAQGSSSTYSRFGAFSVLASASSKPSLPLVVCIRLLQMIVDLQKDADVQNIFTGNRETKEYQECRAYLIAVAFKHVEDFVQRKTSPIEDEACDYASEATSISQICELLAVVALNDYRSNQQETPSGRGLGSTKSLQAVNSCFCALAIVARTKSTVVSKFCESILVSLDVPLTGTNEEKSEAALEALQRLVESLLDDNKNKDITMILQMHQILMKVIASAYCSIEKRSSFLSRQSKWAGQVLSTSSTRDANIAKTLVQLCLMYTSNNDDLRRSAEIAERLLQVIGDCDNHVASQPHSDENLTLSTAKGIDKSTCLTSVDITLDVIERALVDVEWCLLRMKCLETAGEALQRQGGSNDNEREKNNPELKLETETFRRATRAEDAAQVRLEGAVRLVRGLVRCAIGKWTQQERLLKLTSRTYKMLSLATSAQARRKGDPRTTFVSLINEVKSLGPDLWTYLSFVADGSGYDQSGKKSSKATKEARVMPHLIYEVERFEKVLIAAQKRTKIGLLRGMRRNTARDFRIREDKLREEADNLENLNDQEERDDNAGEANRGNSTKNPDKRRRIS